MKLLQECCGENIMQNNILKKPPTSHKKQKSQ